MNPTKHFILYRRKRESLTRSFQLKLQEIQAQGNKLTVYKILHILKIVLSKRYNMTLFFVLFLLNFAGINPLL